MCLRLFKQVSESITHSFNSASPALSPFLANLERSAIKVLALHGSQLSALLEDQVKDLFESFSNTHVVSLESYECTSLVTVLRLLTLRAHSYCSEQDIPPYLGPLESGDPRLLRAINFTLVIYVGSVERFHTGIFNELIQALHNLKDGRCPEVILVVPLQAGTEALDSKLDTSSLPLIDISSVQICENPVSAFESFLEEVSGVMSPSTTFTLNIHLYSSTTKRKKSKGQLLVSFQVHASWSTLHTSFSRKMRAWTKWCPY